MAENTAISYCGCVIPNNRLKRKQYLAKGQMFIGRDPASAAKAYVQAQIENLSIFEDKPDDNTKKKIAKEYKDKIDKAIKNATELAEKEHSEDLAKAKELGEKFFQQQMDRAGVSAMSQFNEV